MFANDAFLEHIDCLPRTFSSFLVGKENVQFVTLTARSTASLEPVDILCPQLLWTPQCQSFFNENIDIHSSFITINSARNNVARTMLVFWTSDYAKYDENQYIRQKFRLPWHGELIVCGTAVANVNQIVNLRGKTDLPDVSLTIDAFVRDILDIGM